jgi:pSer/pThr/pTyr-binding forkhead associated (FHA) protein
MCGAPVSPPPAAPSPGESEDASAPTQIVTIQGRLVVRQTGASIPLYGRSEAIIGRRPARRGVSPDVDLTEHGALEGGVSRRHARVSIREGRVLIEDLDSTNGTFVNQRQLGPGRLQPLNYGDQITLGWIDLVFER